MYSPRAQHNTLGHFFDYLAPNSPWKTRVPPWPPDAFALAASALHASGGYLKVVQNWPPASSKSKSNKAWGKMVREVGLEWQRTSLRGRAPSRVEQWWNAVVKARSTPLQDLRQNDAVCDALIQVCASADEASFGFGIPSEDPRRLTQLEWQANLQLLTSNYAQGASLCKEVSPMRARVLPKLHTPQNGLTIRSLSHHLALCDGDTHPRWWWIPLKSDHALNVLVIPWPKRMRPIDFRAIQMPHMRSKNYGYFEYRRDPLEGWSLTAFKSICKSAEREVGKIDGVVLPECALESKDLDILLKWMETEGLSFLVAGVGDKGVDGKKGSNSALFWARPYLGRGSRGSASEGPITVSYKQPKNNRWKLDSNQILQYGIGRKLDLMKNWWENIELHHRSLNFFAICPWLTISALVCEDLARLDDVSDVLRAVGPNLIIALLMDGPQLSSRWPARYATVLADDPGSSVLTVTSLGMAQLSRPPGKPPSRAVALWKDRYKGETIEIELPSDAEAVVLNLSRVPVEEVTADGRSDGGCAAYLTLTGTHPVKL
jgi:hypothetical protein